MPKVFLQADEIDQRWINSPFYELKRMLPKQKGKRFEEIVRWLMSGEKSKGADSDMQIGTKLYEIKGSTVTKGTDASFSFLQIRPKQCYDFLLFATFHYDGKIELFRIAKEEIQKLITHRLFAKQHEGKNGASETYLYLGSMKPLEKYLISKYQVSQNQDGDFDIKKLS